MDITVDVARHEAVLGDIFKYLLEFDSVNYEHNRFDRELFHSMAAELLEHAMNEEVTTHNRHSRHQIFFGTGTLEDLFSYTRSRDRVFYLTAEITIPAGESVTLNIEMIKHGSYDFYVKGGGNIGVYGYGILTNLNTGLAFDSVTAQITGHERIEITQQNFDFDFEQNILTVPLDLGTAHYFIEVRQASRN